MITNHYIFFFFIWKKKMMENLFKTFFLNAISTVNTWIMIYISFATPLLEKYFIGLLFMMIPRFETHPYNYFIIKSCKEFVGSLVHDFIILIFIEIFVCFVFLLYYIKHLSVLYFKISYFIDMTDDRLLIITFNKTNDLEHFFLIFLF